MASIRSRKDSGLLLIDFRYQGERCREQTLLPDTGANRARLEKLAARIDRALRGGTFCYEDFFPGSPRLKKSQHSPIESEAGERRSSVGDKSQDAPDLLPLYSEFAELWFIESEPRWRKHHAQTMRETLDRIHLPFLAGKRVGELGRADLLSIRAELAKRPGRAGQRLSGKSINKRMTQLKAIVNEACDRYGLPSPARGIKSLKQKRSEVQPFTLSEVDLLVAKVRWDYQPYLVVRCLTGLRTGEVHGLQWCDIDFEAGTLRVERTVSRNGDGETKTDNSRRQIPLIPRVLEALREQYRRRQEGCAWVFHSDRGNPIDAVNFTNRVWYPLLRNLALNKRPPYQMRHTAATLMLASGENPEWVAQILGHSTTEMLFRVYSRFVPNLTRDDGRAFSKLLSGNAGATVASSTDTSGLLEGMSMEQKKSLLADLTLELNQKEKRHDNQ